MQHEPQFQINSNGPVTITLLGKEDGYQKGRFLEALGASATIQLEARLESGSLLKLETPEELILAEVSDSEPNAEGHRARIIIHEWIGKTQLMKLREALDQYSYTPVRDRQTVAV